MSRIADWSFAAESPEQIKAAGFIGGMRYNSPPPNEKNWTPEQIAAFGAARLWRGMVWESTANACEEGFEAGVSAARQHNAMADALGAPGAPFGLYFADDVNRRDPSPTLDFARGVLSVPSTRRRGAYGSLETGEAWLDLGFDLMWQVETWVPDTKDANGNYLWWKLVDGHWRGIPSPRACLMQLSNEHSLSGTDDNLILKDDWGGWAPDGAVQPSEPPQPVMPLHGWQEIDRFLVQQGVAINVPPEDWQTTGGEHSQNSWHYQGMARDYSYGMGCDEAAVVAALLPFAGTGGPIIELFHAATNTWLSHGQYANVGGHTDHCHAAISPSWSLPVQPPRAPIAYDPWDGLFVPIFAS